jgi:hypothetical protein
MTKKFSFKYRKYFNLTGKRNGNWVINYSFQALKRGIHKISKINIQQLWKETWILLSNSG